MWKETHTPRLLYLTLHKVYLGTLDRHNLHSLNSYSSWLAQILPTYLGKVSFPLTGVPQGYVLHPPLFSIDTTSLDCIIYFDIFS